MIFIKELMFIIIIQLKIQVTKFIKSKKFKFNSIDFDFLFSFLEKDLGRFYSSEPLRENINENEEQYYNELLKFFENENENNEIKIISSSQNGNDPVKRKKNQIPIQ